MSRSSSTAQKTEGAAVSLAKRERYGTLSAVIGIGVNLLLFAGKLTAGILSGSVSVRADAVNNLSDAGSSVISLVSFKISAKPADRDHPFGHARIEYVASLIVSVLILLIGVELVKGSVEKLRAPEAPEFRALTVVILGVSILLKLGLALFNYRLGKKIASKVLRATAVDSLSDVAATAAVLAATVIAPFLPERAGAILDPVMGLLVAVLIFVAGIRVLLDTKNSILGERPDPAIVDTITSVMAEYPDVLGVHDLVIHSYGAGHILASVHAEVDGKKDIFASHDTVDLIERRLRAEYGISCSIHLDPVVVDDADTNEWRERLSALAAGLDSRLKIHDFRMVPGTTHTNLIFDLTVPFELRLSDSEIKAKMADAIAAEAPNYFAVITVDRV